MAKRIQEKRNCLICQREFLTAYKQKKFCGSFSDKIGCSYLVDNHFKPKFFEKHFTKNNGFYKNIEDLEKYKSSILAYRIASNNIRHLRRIYKGSSYEEMMEDMADLISDYIGKPCDYCGEIVTYENCALDHKNPINWRKAKNKLLSEDELLELNHYDNLHFIDKKCNRIKSDIPDKQFKKLMDFIKTDKILEEKIINRLSRSLLLWKR